MPIHTCKNLSTDVLSVGAPVGGLLGGSLIARTRRATRPGREPLLDPAMHRLDTPCVRAMGFIEREKVLQSIRLAAIRTVGTSCVGLGGCVYRLALGTVVVCANKNANKIKCRCGCRSFIHSANRRDWSVETLILHPRRTSAYSFSYRCTTPLLFCSPDTRVATRWQPGSHR